MKMKKPNTEKLKLIIDDLNIKPNFISTYFLEQGMFEYKERKIKGKDKFETRKIPPVANRTFSEILNGKETKEENLKALAELFSNLYKRNDKNKIISISDISIEEEGPLKNNLRIVNNYNELINDRFSIYRVPFFNFDINEETEPKVNRLIKLIDEIYDSYFAPSIIDDGEERYNLSNYLKEIKNISEINSSLKFLSEKKIYLYTGVLKNIPIIRSNIESRKEYVEGMSDYPDIHYYFDATAELNKTDFNIYYFTNYRVGNYIEAIYKPHFKFSEIEKEIKKNQFKKSYELEYSFQDEGDIFNQNYSKISEKAKFDCMSFFGDLFYKKFNHTAMLPFNFERDKIEFVAEKNKYDKKDYVKGQDPMFDQYLEENNLTYEEAMERGEDQYGQMYADFLLGK